MTTITTTPVTCPCCGKPVHQYYQASIFADRPGHTLAECHTTGCDLYYVTLEISKLAKLTEVEIDSYRRAAKGNHAPLFD